MNEFVDLLRESVLTQFIVTILLVGVVVFLAVTGQAIPEVLSLALSAVLGFYFGSKAENLKVRSSVDKIVEREFIRRLDSRNMIEKDCSDG